MKKILIPSGTILLSLVITFLLAEIFSLYHFGSVPTLLTLLYLISIFSIFEYILVTILYIIKKIIKKEKISIKKITGLILCFIALILILSYLVILDIDWLNWYAYSSPFYINVIIRSLEFLLPAVILIVISIFLLKKENNIPTKG